MTGNVKILHLEDLHSDVELVGHALKRGGITFDRLVVDNRLSYAKALIEFEPDIILSDHNLPAFNSHEALNLFAETDLNIPFLLITASISEDFAVDILKRGADDYIVKDRLERLPSAMTNALEKYRLKRDYQIKLDEISKNEKHFRALIENSNDAIATISETGSWLYQSPAAGRLSDYKLDDILNRNVFGYAHPDDLDHLRLVFQQAKEQPNIPIPYIGRLRKKDSHYLYTEGTIVNLLHDESVKAFVMNFKDCSERVAADQERSKMVDDLRQRNTDLEQFSYIVSHNLRAPVANIIGLADELREDLSFSEVKSITDYLVLSATKLDRIIIDLNSVLQVKKEVSEKKETVNICEVINDIRLSISQLISDEDVIFSLRISASTALWTIKPYLQSIFYNLISNSIKYRQPDLAPIIQIGSELNGGKLVVTYRDNGLGIDLKKHEKNLFGLYKRFHHHVEGKGMGLFMVKTQLDAIGGMISVVSACDEGTTFTLTFEHECPAMGMQIY
ncbi:sensor histidine kinase [Pedobacter sp.]|uniref:sensor histidine kinase n=1 Tax=Pedobacter sp. TaxID=1411316 RepID=UPI003D7F6E94